VDGVPLVPTSSGDRLSGPAALVVVNDYRTPIGMWDCLRQGWDRARRAADRQFPGVDRDEQWLPPNASVVWKYMKGHEGDSRTTGEQLSLADPR